MNISPALLGFIRALGVTVILAVVSFLANAANLHGIVNDSLATILAAIALSFEHKIESNGGGSLFGAVKRS